MVLKGWLSDGNAFVKLRALVPWWRTKKCHKDTKTLRFTK
jgi:hypothetical protein